MGNAEDPREDPPLAQRISLSAISSVHAVLDRNGLFSRSRKPRYDAQGNEFAYRRIPSLMRRRRDELRNHSSVTQSALDATEWM